MNQALWLYITLYFFQPAAQMSPGTGLLETSIPSRGGGRTLLVAAYYFENRKLRRKDDTLWLDT